MISDASSVMTACYTEHLHDQLPTMFLRRAHNDHVTLLNDAGEGCEGMSNTMRYLIWLHGALVSIQEGKLITNSAIHTLRGMKNGFHSGQPGGSKGEPVLGAAMYELHIIEHFVPSNIQVFSFFCKKGGFLTHEENGTMAPKLWKI